MSPRCCTCRARRIVGKIGLPNAVPDILAGMRLSLTVALILAVIGEMLSGQEGLGSAILLAARAFRAADLYAGIVLLGLVGLHQQLWPAFAWSGVRPAGGMRAMR